MFFCMGTTLSSKQLASFCPRVNYYCSSQTLAAAWDLCDSGGRKHSLSYHLFCGPKQFS